MRSLIESTRLIFEDEHKNLVDYIIRDCQPFLRKWKNRDSYFAKGIKLDVDWKKEVFHSDQRPHMYSNINFAKTLHDAMQDDGFIATRLNGNFVFPSQLVDEIPFGNTYVVIPTGDFSLTWQNRTVLVDGGSSSTTRFIKDVLYNQLDDNLQDKEELEKWLERQHRPDFYGFESEDFANAFWDIYGHNFSHGDNVDRAMNSGGEVIIKSPGVYYVKESIYSSYIKEMIKGA